MDETIVLILLAEDNHLVATNLLVGLEDAGYQVIHAGNGKEAIDTLNDRASDIKALITDIKLGPGPDGWQVAHHARTVNPSLPIIYASADSADSWAAHGVPNSLMLQKPFAIAQLVTAVSQLITAVAATPSSPPAG